MLEYFAHNLNFVTKFNIFFFFWRYVHAAVVSIRFRVVLNLLYIWIGTHNQTAVCVFYYIQLNKQQEQKKSKLVCLTWIFDFENFSNKKLEMTNVQSTCFYLWLIAINVLFNKINNKRRKVACVMCKNYILKLNK